MQLETDWRQVLEARDRHLGMKDPSERLALREGPPSGASEVHATSPDRTRTDAEAVTAAYQRWQSARRHLQPTLDWYDRVYRRVTSRIEEDQILTEAGMVLVATPALIFYPIVRWNVRTVLWDGTDPDSATDPVTMYCTDRLAQEQGRVP